MDTTVLVVDDEPGLLFSISNFLNKQGFATQNAPNLKEAKKIISADLMDAIILDMHLPDGNGIEWVPSLRSKFPTLAIIIITGEGDIPMAVKAMQNGADHFVTKPVNLEDLMVFLNKSLEIRNLRRSAINNKRLKKILPPFWSENDLMKQVRKLVNIASGSDAPVLLLGETGTGKGVIAHWIHEQSQRNKEPFVEINCTSLKGELLASELFGHRRGAFTSAVEDKQGLIEVADGGTLFLDEIGDMDIEIQTQFLKVIEEKQFRRLGDIKTIKSDFRLICATNRDLAFDVEEGRIRQDLFYRINVFPIELPALRDRQEDIQEMILYLLHELGADRMKIPNATRKLLNQYRWPGNIRELKNVLERAVLLSDGDDLIPYHLIGLASASSKKRPSDEGMNLDVVESRHIERVLMQCGKDTQNAAKILGISRASLYRKMNKYQLK